MRQWKNTFGNRTRIFDVFIDKYGFSVVETIEDENGEIVLQREHIPKEKR